MGCGEKVLDEGDKTAAKFCTSCGCERGGDPTPSPPDDCKEDDDRIVLTDKNELKCKKIKKQELCGEKVKNEGDKTAADFCTSCGCGGSAPPTPSPPDEDCTLGDSDTLQLTTKKNEQTCAKIVTKKLCDDAVENQEDKTAADFCLSCGCGGSTPPTPSPPDEDNCKGADDTLKIKNEGEKTCAEIKEKGFCKKKVEKEEQDGNKKNAFDFCTSCGC